MHHRKAALKTLLALALAALLAACATAPEVEGIVDETNAALTADGILRDTELPRLEAYGGPESGRQGADWQADATALAGQSVARIDAFLAAHGQNPRLAGTVNALRLRKAVLLLAGGQTNMARAAFAEFNPALAGNVRDLALYRAYPALSWWWDVAGERVSPGAFAADATEQLKMLDEAIASAPPRSAIGYYLATVASQAYLKWASTETDPRPRLKQGLERFSAAFDAEARQGVASWARGDTDALGDAPPENVRWYGHAGIVFDEYDRFYRAFLDETWQAFGTEPENLDPALRRLCERGELERAPVWPESAAWLVELD